MKRHAVLICFCLFSCWGFSKTLTVALDGSGDYTRIQSAIQASKTGDIIVVRPGIYVENVQFLGKNIFLRSENPEDWSVDRANHNQGRYASRCHFSGNDSAIGRVYYSGWICTTAAGFWAVYLCSYPSCIIRNNTAEMRAAGFNAGLVESCPLQATHLHMAERQPDAMELLSSIVSVQSSN